MEALPVLIYNYSSQPYADLVQVAWGAALLLMVVVLVLSIGSPLVRRPTCGRTPMTDASVPTPEVRSPSIEEVTHRAGRAGVDGEPAGQRRDDADGTWPWPSPGGPRYATCPSTCHAGEVTALIGPSGSGKTTVLRALNRMHDTVRSATVTGSIHLGDLDVNGPDTDPTLLRSRVGMVFQRPNPFPTMSIYDNAVAGLRFNGVRKKALLDEAAESALIAAALWDSVKDRLKANGGTLSGGEQQRLCIARALAVEPDVLLMDDRRRPSIRSPPSASRNWWASSRTGSPS